MKTCDDCGKHEAIYQVKVIDPEGNAQELNLCEGCARKWGLEEGMKLSVAELFAKALREKVEAEEKELVCPSCGLSYLDFRKLGRLGCAQCYQAFQARLLPLIQRVQGAAHHIGKRPALSPKPDRLRWIAAKHLREELEKAVAQEEYEKAARIRDELKRIEDEA